MTISFGGGLSGTGVPLDFKKVNTDHSQRQIPKASKGMDRTRFTGASGHALKFNSLSDKNARKMMKITAQKNNKPAREVSRP